MLFGKRGFIRILIMISLLLILSAVPLVMAYMRKGPPNYQLTDIRNQDFLPPYDLTQNKPYSPENHYTVYGKYFDYQYSDTSTYSPPHKGKTKEPLAILEAAPGEVVTLPDGEIMKLAGLKIVPRKSVRDVYEGVAEELEVEEVYYSETGESLSHEEAMKLYNRQHYQSGKVSINQYPDGTAWGIHVLVESTVERSSLENPQLRDALTGGRISTPSAGWSSTIIREPEAEFKNFTSFYFSTLAVRPTPPKLFLKVWQGEEQSFKMLTKAGESFTWDDQEYTIMQIATYDKVQNKAVVVEGDPDFESGSRMVLNPDTSKIVFDDLPKSVTSFNVFNSDGEKLQNMGYTGSEYVYDVSPDQFEWIEFTVKPDFAYVVLELPILPVVPEENRDKTSFMEMALPNVVIETEYHYENFISCLLQANHSGAQIRKINPITYPLEIKDMTVGEFLQQHHDQFEYHDVVIQKGHHDPTIMYTQVDERLLRDGAKKFKTLNFILEKLPYLSSLALLLMLLKGTIMFLANTIKSNIRLRGYDVDLWQSEYFLYYLRTKAWNLPQRDELGTIPGVDPDDPKSIAEFMRRQRNDSRS